MMRRLLLAPLLLAACNTAGERAETGECPVGETCSPATPRGLHFIGNTLAVALVGDVQTSSGADSQRLVDTSMILDLPGAVRTGWDAVKLANAQPGSYTLMVTAGDKPAAPLPVEIVAVADAVTPIDAGTPM